MNEFADEFWENQRKADETIGKIFGEKPKFGKEFLKTENLEECNSCEYEGCSFIREPYRCSIIGKMIVGEGQYRLDNLKIINIPLIKETGESSKN